jgi:hypothetical protein
MADSGWRIVPDGSERNSGSFTFCGKAWMGPSIGRAISYQALAANFQIVRNGLTTLMPAISWPALRSSLSNCAAPALSAAATINASQKESCANSAMSVARETVSAVVGCEPMRHGVHDFPCRGAGHSRREFPGHIDVELLQNLNGQPTGVGFPEFSKPLDSAITFRARISVVGVDENVRINEDHVAHGVHPEPRKCSQEAVGLRRARPPACGLPRSARPLRPDRVIHPPEERSRLVPCGQRWHVPSSEGWVRSRP